MLSITLSIRQQAITWTNVCHDLWCNMASLRDWGKTTCHNFTVFTSLTFSTTPATFRYLLDRMDYIPSWCMRLCLSDEHVNTFMSLIRKNPQCIALACCSHQCSWLIFMSLLCSVMSCCCNDCCHQYPDSKVHGANMGPIWGRQDPGGPHVGPMNLAIWVMLDITLIALTKHNAHFKGFLTTVLPSIQEQNVWLILFIRRYQLNVCLMIEAINIKKTHND